MNYNSLYEHPLWRAKRKEILKRDKRTCKACGAKKQLQVHHTKYTGKPWEAPNEDLITLCQDCHSKADYEQDLSIKTAASSIGFLLCSDIVEIRFYFLHSTGKAILIQDEQGVKYWLPACILHPTPECFSIFNLNIMGVARRWAEEVNFPLGVKE